MRVDEMASPVVALRCDGAFYDVATLEERWRSSAWAGGSDFHLRVFATGASGLAEIDQRLRSGDRPTEARLLERDMVLLPPIDVERATVLLAEPVAAGAPRPSVRWVDARAAVGPGQPVPVPEGGLELRAGVALAIGEELARSGPREASRACVGVVPYLHWSVAAGIPGAGLVPDGPLQLGPVLSWGVGPRALADVSAELRVGDRRHEVGVAPGPWSAAEVVAYASHVASLRPGDLLGLPPAKVVAVSERRRVRWHVGRWGPLEGWATREPPPPDWRL